MADALGHQLVTYMASPDPTSTGVPLLMLENTEDWDAECDDSVPVKAVPRLADFPPEEFMERLGWMVDHLAGQIGLEKWETLEQWIAENIEPISHPATYRDYVVQECANKAVFASGCLPESLMCQTTLSGVEAWLNNYIPGQWKTYDCFLKNYMLAVITQTSQRHSQPLSGPDEKSSACWEDILPQFLRAAMVRWTADYLQKRLLTHIKCHLGDIETQGIRGNLFQCLVEKGIFRWRAYLDWRESDENLGHEDEDLFFNKTFLSLNVNKQCSMPLKTLKKQIRKLYEETDSDLFVKTLKKQITKHYEETDSDMYVWIIEQIQEHWQANCTQYLEILVFLTSAKAAGRLNLPQEGLLKWFDEDVPGEYKDLEDFWATYISVIFIDRLQLTSEQLPTQSEQLRVNSEQLSTEGEQSPTGSELSPSKHPQTPTDKKTLSQFFPPGLHTISVDTQVDILADTYSRLGGTVAALEPLIELLHQALEADIIGRVAILRWWHNVMQGSDQFNGDIEDFVQSTESITMDLCSDASAMAALEENICDECCTQETLQWIENNISGDTLSNLNHTATIVGIMCDRVVRVHQQTAGPLVDFLKEYLCLLPGVTSGTKEVQGLVLGYVKECLADDHQAVFDEVCCVLWKYNFIDAAGDQLIQDEESPYYLQKSLGPEVNDWLRVECDDSTLDWLDERLPRSWWTMQHYVSLVLKEIAAVLSCDAMLGKTTSKACSTILTRLETQAPNFWYYLQSTLHQLGSSPIAEQTRNAVCKTLTSVGLTGSIKQQVWKESQYSVSPGGHQELLTILKKYAL